MALSRRVMVRGLLAITVFISLCSTAALIAWGRARAAAEGHEAGGAATMQSLISLATPASASPPPRSGAATAATATDAPHAPRARDPRPDILLLMTDEWRCVCAARHSVSLSESHTRKLVGARDLTARYDSAAAPPPPLVASAGTTGTARTSTRQTGRCRSGCRFSTRCVHAASRSARRASRRASGVRTLPRGV